MIYKWSNQPIYLKALKSTLKQHISYTTRAGKSYIHHRHTIWSKYPVCMHQNLPSVTCSIPWALHTLYSRYRVGKVESCGVYSCHLKWLANPWCHFCGYPCKTIFHLLTSCPDTTTFCVAHGISFDTLVNETSENILLITQQFDTFLFSASLDVIIGNPALCSLWFWMQMQQKSTRRQHKAPIYSQWIEQMMKTCHSASWSSLLWNTTTQIQKVPTYLAVTRAMGLQQIMGYSS